MSRLQSWLDCMIALTNWPARSCVTMTKIRRNCGYPRIAAGYSAPKKPQDSGNDAALIGDIPSRLGSLYDYVINHTRIAHVYVINMHASAGFDRGFDHFAILVHNVTRPFENITARSIRTVLANNESFERLIIGRRPFLSCHFDDRSRYGYWLRGSCPLPCILRTRLRKCQRRKHCAAGQGNNCFLHYLPPFDVNDCFPSIAINEKERSKGSSELRFFWRRVQNLLWGGKV